MRVFRMLGSFWLWASVVRCGEPGGVALWSCHLSRRAGPRLRPVGRRWLVVDAGTGLRPADRGLSLAGVCQRPREEETVTSLWARPGETAGEITDGISGTFALIPYHHRPHRLPQRPRARPRRPPPAPRRPPRPTYTFPRSPPATRGTPSTASRLPFLPAMLVKPPPSSHSTAPRSCRRNRRHLLLLPPSHPRGQFHRS